MVGSLSWLVTGSRVDIAFADTCCAKYSINSGMAHWYALLRILRYLEGTKGYGLLYRRQPRDVEFWSVTACVFLGMVLCFLGNRRCNLL